ncbi:serine hydrolase domain-containing protein [Steroidobacter sp.]|uniref:serine hydrolase domain-containing protein n=1 Tax=Steroidobacter sp. TaxID=1978227 RepID=UPI001A3DDD56|nr:serine hydrolase domain-containing protein [Steroidobacter sp.]MBL8267169.1 beta-lactamase family protein [Steroidobacter sp.]
MKFIVRSIVAASLATLTFSALASSVNTRDAQVIRAFETGLRPALQFVGDKPVRWNIDERMAYWHVPGVSIAVIRDGKLAWVKTYGVKRAGSNEAIDAQTVFSVGSLSKVGAAAVTLRLADVGKIDIDRDIGAYLKRWQVPSNAYTQLQPVTLRGILSHTAGMNLGNFPDFQPGEALPTNLDTLRGVAPSKTAPLRVDFIPGTHWRYSGGAVQVEQLAIEDVTGVSFVEAARNHVLEPLGMRRSTYVNPLPETHGNIAFAHDEKGQPRALPRGYEAFPEMAASGLWSTPSDYAQLVIALLDSYRGQTNGKNKAFLSRTLARQVMTEVGPSPVGLGVFLEGTGMGRRFFHTGANESYRAYMEANLATGNGVVMFTNGANGSKLYAELRRSMEAAEGWPETEVITVPKVAVAPERLAALAGNYGVDPVHGPINIRSNLATEPVMFKVWVENGALRLTEDGAGDVATLVPADETHFVYESHSNYSIEFVTGYHGTVDGLIFRRSNYSFEATRVNQGAKQ